MSARTGDPPKNLSSETKHGRINKCSQMMLAETRFLSVASRAWPPLRCGGQGRAIAANPASI